MHVCCVLNCIFVIPMYYSNNETSLKFITMKKKILFSIIAMFALVVNAQEIDYKFGDVSKEEIEMKVYQPDSSAIAVVLHMDGYTTFQVLNTNLQMYTEEKHRIKILKDDGVEYATIEIPYYKNSKSSGLQETISQIEASAYNIEDGEVVREKMPKKYIFRELVYGNHYVVKLSIPNVRKGTVIEYKFKRSFNRATNVDPWIIQQKIPVKSSIYRTSIPKYFRFRHEARGYEYIQRIVTESAVNTTLDVDPQGFIMYEDIVFTAHDVPAIKNESFIWSISDYRSAIAFELEGVAFPRQIYKNYTNTWEDVITLLKNSSSFGGKLNMRNPLKDQTQQLALDSLSTYDKAIALLTLLKQRIKWNDRFSLFCKDIKETVESGVGNNGDINFIYMSMLEDVGIESTPVLLRLRSSGRLPITHASLDKINTFIVMIKGENGERYFMDGSSDYGTINLIDTELMVEMAIIYDAPEGCQEINLTKVGDNRTICTNLVKILDDGSIEGTHSISYSGQVALAFKKSYANSKEELDFVKEIEDDYNISIEDYTIDGDKTLGSTIREKFKFTKENSTSGDQIYIDPMVFKDETKNYFTNLERKFPVEFPYMQNVRIQNTFMIPEGYVVDVLPQSQKILMADNKLMVVFLVRNVGNMIQVSYNFIIIDCLVNTQEYDDLKIFWEKLLEINNEQIILKRVESK